MEKNEATALRDLLKILYSMNSRGLYSRSDYGNIVETSIEYHFFETELYDNYCSLQRHSQDDIEKITSSLQYNWYERYIKGTLDPYYYKIADKQINVYIRLLYNKLAKDGNLSVVENYVPPIPLIVRKNNKVDFGLFGHYL